MPVYDQKLQVMAIWTALCSDRNRAQLGETRAGELVCRESTWKRRGVPGLAELPEGVGTEVPTERKFRQVLGQSTAVMGESCRNFSMSWMSLNESNNCLGWKGA